MNKRIEDPASTLIKDVYSVDTKAGDALRYIITRSRCDEQFAESIWYDDFHPCDLNILFVFYLTKEGPNYWAKINTILDSRKTSRRDKCA